MPISYATKPARCALCTNQTCLSLWERCRAATERAGSLPLTHKPNLSLPLGEMSRSDREGWLPREGAGLPLRGKTEGVASYLSRIRQTLICLALSVICCANASSPKGRAKKPVRTAHLTNQVDSYTDLPACCSFRRGLRRATFLREEGFGFPHNPTRLSLWERCRVATERAGSLFEGAG